MPVSCVCTNIFTQIGHRIASLFLFGICERAVSKAISVRAKILGTPPSSKIVYPLLSNKGNRMFTEKSLYFLFSFFRIA